MLLWATLFAKRGTVVVIIIGDDHHFNVVRQVFSFLPRVMPRGWCRPPDGWWQRSLRGPRPKSEVWPRAQQSRQSGSPQSVHGITPPLSRQVSKPPEKVAADAVGEIQRLQAAIAAFFWEIRQRS